MDVLEEPGKYPCCKVLISPTELRSLRPGRLSLLTRLAHNLGFQATPWKASFAT
jgi:hypothetical protein